MSELEEAWVVALAEAEARAHAAGRGDISEYLALRSANDRIRRMAQDWLLAEFEKVAEAANLKAMVIQIVKDEDHRFKVGTTTMAGKRLSLGKGVRRLVVEVGWPRTPRDGFLRGGGLACAHIKHRGVKSANEQLRLFMSPDGPPRWITHKGGELHEAFHAANVRDHISLLLDDSRTDHRP